MKYCIFCGVSNYKRVFVESACPDCVSDGKVSAARLDNGVVAADLANIVLKNKEELRLKNKRIWSEKKKVPKERKRCLDKKELAYKRDKNGDIVLRDWVRPKDLKVLLIPVCKICGGAESEDKPFRDIVTPRGVFKRRQHRDCSSVVKKSDLCLKCGGPEQVDNLFHSYVKPNGKKVGRRVHIRCMPGKRSSADNLLALPETKVCSKCGDNKPIGMFYLNKNNVPNYRCKACVKLVNLSWKERNREKMLAYMREYHKGYKRSEPKRNKSEIFMQPLGVYCS